MHEFLALQKEGARECRAPVHPQPRVRNGGGKMHTSIHSEFTEITRHSRTQWFTAYTHSPRRSGFLVSVASRNDPQGLAPASRRQDHTTSPSASVPLVRSTSTSTTSHPASVTIAIRPSCGTRRGRICR